MGYDAPSGSPVYCTHCDIHFSGSSAAGRCPYCGRSADAPASDERPQPRNEAPRVRSRPAAPAAEAAARESGDDSTRTELATEWAPGSLVAGKYEIVSRLGAGGFGTVFKVRHIFRKKYYALKTPHLEFARDETFRVRFEREIEAMERFVHTDAVMIRDSGVTENGTPYYTMDFIDGESLKAVMRREERLPVERALPIIRRVLRVLEVAHGHHIIHRDIKPDNIMVTSASGRETVKVLDFGVAKLLDLVGETGSVSKGMRVGTPRYMSPEQIAGEPLDPRSDLFSLGIVFYEMVCGRHPFAQQDDPIRVTAAILGRDPVPPRELVPGLPRAVDDHILWMLEKKSRRRPESAETLIRKLGEVDEGPSRVEASRRIAVFDFPPRQAARPLVLRQETSVGERRSFLLFADRVSFGRSNDPQRGIRNDLLLRCLPCRSQALDPENWQRNLTISQRAGWIQPDGAALVLEPAPQARSGLVIGGVRSNSAARIQADRFHLSLGDRALELDGYRRLRGENRPEHDFGFLSHARPADARSSDLIGYSNGACIIDHVLLQRASNWPLHEYFLVYRELRIGSAATCGLRLRCPGVEAVHAVIIFEEGEAFLLPLEGDVSVRRRVDGPLEGAPPREGGGLRDVPATALLPLASGLEIVLGDAVLRVDDAVESLYKTA